MDKTYTVIECPICHKQRTIRKSAEKWYTHNACYNCKNIFTNITRFSHIIWYHISLSGKVWGPYKTLTQAKNNKPESKFPIKTVSYNRKTGIVKTYQGKLIGYSQTKLIERVANETL